MSETVEVELPTLSPSPKGIAIVSKGSHYVVSHAYEVSKNDTPIYKHIILNTDLSNFTSTEPIRKFTGDAQLYSLDKIIESADDTLKCAKILFSKSLLDSKCSTDSLIQIKNIVKSEKCIGLFDRSGNILLYSEQDILSRENYQIKYKNTIPNDFLYKFFIRK